MQKLRLKRIILFLLLYITTAPSYAQEQQRNRQLVAHGQRPRQDVLRHSAKVQLSKWRKSPLHITQSDHWFFSEGTWDRAYQKLGAHQDTMHGLNGQSIKGTRFAVFAPYAERARVMVKKLDGTVKYYQMKHDGKFWTRFIPGVRSGDVYEYVFEKNGQPKQWKADPYAFDTSDSAAPGTEQVIPGRQSKVANIDNYQWNDAQWISQRQKINWDQGHPLNAMELHPNVMHDKNGKPLKWQKLFKWAVQWAKMRGKNYVELMGLAMHPLDISMGYQVVSQYAPNNRHGSPKDLMEGIDYAHQNGIGVIMDWVPAHFPRDAHGLHWFGHGHLYSSGDERKREFAQWTTDKLDLETRPDIGRANWSFLLSSARYWLDKYHIDGIRQDAVAANLYLDYDGGKRTGLRNSQGGNLDLEGIDFMKENNRRIHRQFPGVVTIAEESSGFPGVTDKKHGLGFDKVWAMGWMHDTIFEFLKREPMYRKHHFNQFHNYFNYWQNFRGVLVDSHDEVINGKNSTDLPGADDWQRFAQMRLLAGVQFFSPGAKTKWIGNDFKAGEWSKGGGLNWRALKNPMSRKLLKWHDVLGKFYLKNRALWEYGPQQNEKYNYIGSDPQKVVEVWHRHGGSKDFVVVSNADLVAQPAPYRIGFPKDGTWRIATFNGQPLNSDDTRYGGSGYNLPNEIRVEGVPYHNQPYSAEIAIPPNGVVVYERLH